jgi:hypothetical protein
MNNQTKQFIESEILSKLYDNLHVEHRPIKAKYRTDILEGIGLVIAKFQRLENTIMNFVMVLLEKLQEQDLIDILLHKVAYKDLVAIMVSVSSKTKWHHHGKLIELSKLAIKSEEVRNQIVHSQWFAKGRMKKSLNKKDGKVNLKFEEYDVNELRKIAETIDRIDTSLDALAFKFLIKLLKGKP